MHVKGVAFIAREAFLVKQVGEPAWRGFFTEWLAEHPGFGQPVMPVTKIPAEQFLALNDAIVRRFFGGDTQAFWSFGEQSGTFALTQGQLKGLFQLGEYRRFLQFTPSIWKGYFDGGELTARDSGGSFEIRITGTPPHVYFEYSVIGFAIGGLRALGMKDPAPQRIHGFGAGDGEVLYRFSA